jgi:selenocysteine lyase/cysteine desulfurase
LAAKLRQRLSEIPSVTVHDRGTVQGGIVTFAVDGVVCSDVTAELRRAGINTSSPRVASARIDMEDRGLPGLVRASVHYFNTDEELDALTAAIAGLAA